MAGSKGGKQSKRKGKSKSSKFEASNCKHDLGHTSNPHPDRSSDPKDGNPRLDSSYPISTDRYSYTENELEDLLYVKLEVLYIKVKEQLLTSGYSMAEVETAVLHAGYFQGPMDLLNNVLKNLIIYIETKVQPNTEVFEKMDELIRSMVETMVNSEMQTRQGMQRSDAVWYLLIRKWDLVPSTTTSSHLKSSLIRNEEIGDIVLSSAEKVLSGSQIDSALKKVGIFERINLEPALVSHFRRRVLILADAVRSTIWDPVIGQQGIPSTHRKPTEVADVVSSDFPRTIASCSDEASLGVWLGSNSDDPNAAHLVDLIMNYIELHEKAKEQKEWAQKKVVDSAKRISKNNLEINMLRLEKLDLEKIKIEKTSAEKLCILTLMEAEQSVRKANSERLFLVDSTRILDWVNAEIAADIEAIKLNASEKDIELTDVLKRVKRSFKNLADNEKQASIFHSQIQDEKQRVLQLEEDLLQGEDEANKAEEKWREEILEKERTFTYLTEEMRMIVTQKAKSKTQLLKLKQKVEIDSELARDDLHRLEDELSRLQLSSEDELSRLHLSSPVPDMFEDVDFLYNSIEASSFSAANSAFESSEKHVRHCICMMCSKNEVSIVFLPCTHQVLCFYCYSENFETAGGRCPYCNENIEESIKVYRPSS